MALEAALHLLPVQNGLAGGDPTPDWPTHRLRPDVHYTFSDAWDLRNVHRGFTNNMGYVAPFPYRPGSDGIAVVGNSFIEGLMNRYEETLQGQLARLLPDAPAMLNFGVSGASLADRLPAAYGVPPERVILVFDADRAELYRSHGMSTSSSCATRDSVARNALATAAASRGEHVIDMGPVFAAYFKATGGRLDYSPSDWHWNAAGHRLAAAEVARIMRLGTPERDRTPGPP